MMQPLGTTHSLTPVPAGLMHIYTYTKNLSAHYDVCNCTAGWHFNRRRAQLANGCQLN